MSQLRTVKPAEGRRIRDPDDRKHRVLPPEGKAVTWSSYWQRALDAKDIVVAETPRADAKGVTADKPPAPPAAQTKSAS